MRLAAAVLAAGKGTRMKSRRPKVLHRVGGRPMLDYVLEAVKGTGAERVVVVAGYCGEEVAEAVGGAAEVVYQREQLGTAHALLQVRPLLEGYPGHVLVVCGDTPLIRVETLSRLVQHHVDTGAAATLLTAVVPEPGGYGRVVRGSDGKVVRIVEQKDASPEELAINEINSGIYCFRVEGLFEALSSITPGNAQGEYYLTDIVGIYARRGEVVAAVVADDAEEVLGVNDRCQLAGVERILRERKVRDLMLSGVTVIDPATTFVDSDVVIGCDTVIYPFTIIEAGTRIGEDCVVGPSTRIAGSVLGNRVVAVNSVILDSTVGDDSNIGPFAYIRPGCVLGRGVRVGDFVELKKSSIGNFSKVPHLSYIGDATVGERVNIGAGTITCNYDGRAKHPTIIGDRAFIGSNANLVAPVEVGSDAVIGAGSTITKDVPAGALGVARGRQKNIPDWDKRRPKG